jgi:hypothetical protein
VKTLFIGLVWNRRHLGSAWQGERIGTGEQRRLSEFLDEQPIKVSAVGIAVNSRITTELVQRVIVRILVPPMGQ